MKTSMFGVLVAGTVAGMIGSAALAQADNAASETKTEACYRKHCSKSIASYEGQCAGTKVEQLDTKAACEHAGGAWTTADDAAKLPKK